MTSYWCHLMQLTKIQPIRHHSLHVPSKINWKISKMWCSVRIFSDYAAMISYIIEFSVYSSKFPTFNLKNTKIFPLPIFWQKFCTPHVFLSKLYFAKFVEDSRNVFSRESICCVESCNFGKLKNSHKKIAKWSFTSYYYQQKWTRS